MMTNYEIILGKMARLNFEVEENGESELADQIRDEMDKPYRDLTNVQQEKIGLLSEAIQQYYEHGRPCAGTEKLYEAVPHHTQCFVCQDDIAKGAAAVMFYGRGFRHTRCKSHT